MRLNSRTLRFPPCTAARKGSGRVPLVLGLLLCLVAPAAAASRQRAAAPARREVVTHFFVPGSLHDPAGMQTVIGTSRMHKAGRGQSLAEIARRYDLGVEELASANRELPALGPRPAGPLLLPTEWILPQGQYEGIVINIPELRLYYYVPSPRHGARSSMVITYPIGLGSQDRARPTRVFRVREKTREPAGVPAQEELSRQRHGEGSMGGLLAPRGDSDSPLEGYVITLTLAPYAIHGTNDPSAIGSRGGPESVRMYPEDIEAFFPLVQVGTPGRFAYQPVKVGMRRGRVTVEVHADPYGIAPWPWLLARDLIEKMGLDRYVDPELLEAAVAVATGIPTDISYVPWPHVEQPEPLEFDEHGDPLEPYGSPGDSG